MVRSRDGSRDRSELREHETAGGMALHGGNGLERDRSARGTATPIAGPSDVRRGKKEVVKDDDYESAEEVLDIDDLLKVDLNEPLEAGIMKSPPVKLTTLKGRNYHIWAQELRCFFESREVFGIIDGGIPMPRKMEPARRWAKLDGWITTIMSGYMDEHQKGHIYGKRTSKAQWDALKRIHGVSGKGRLRVPGRLDQ